MIAKLGERDLEKWKEEDRLQHKRDEIKKEGKAKKRAETNRRSQPGKEERLTLSRRERRHHQRPQKGKGGMHRLRDISAVKSGG